MVLSEQQFTETTRGLAIGILKGCENRKFDRSETAAIAGAALVEVLGTVLGPVAAVERLRDLSDLMERQVMAEMN